MANSNIYPSVFTGDQIDARLAAIPGIQESVASFLAHLADYYTKPQVDSITAAIAATVNSTAAVVAAYRPEASAATLGKMYYIGPDNNGEYERYVTSYDGTTYSWAPLGSSAVDFNRYDEAIGLTLGISQDIDLNAENKYHYSVTSSGKLGTSTTYAHMKIPICLYPGKKVRITSNSLNGARFGFATAYVSSSGADIPFVPDTGIIQMEVNQTSEYDIPSGTQWLYVNVGDKDGYTSLPAAVVIFDDTPFSADIKALENDTTVEEWTRHPDVALSGFRYDSTIASVSTSRNRVFRCEMGKKYRIIYANGGSTIRCGFTERMPSTSQSPVNRMTNLPANNDFVVTAPLNGYFGISFQTDAFSFAAYEYHGDTLGGIVAHLLGDMLQQTIRPRFELGAITSSGTDSTAISETNILNSIRTSLFLSIDSDESIASVEVDEGDVVTVFCYNRNFSLIGTVSVGELLLSGTCWARINITNETGIPVTRSRQVVVNSRRPIQTAKCSFSLDTVSKMVFEVNIPHITGEYAQPIRTADSAKVMLPYNYTRDGSPVPLVLWCHGTGGQAFDAGGLGYSPYLQLLTKNGYAVVDCSGITAYYGSELYGHMINDLEDSKNSPLLIACYAALVSHVTEKFNIRADGIYIAAKSAGGLVASMLSYYAPFHVRAVANLAPAISMVGQSWRITGVIPVTFWMENYGIDTTGWADMSQAERAALIADNADKVYGYDPLFIGSPIDSVAAIQLMMSIAYPGTTVGLASAYAANPDLMAMFNVPKDIPVPMKIWHAPDDTVVPILWTNKYVEMARRGNGICELRLMPVGTGGHHSVDTDDNAPRTNYVCENGQTYNVPLAFAEVLDWFKRW